MTGSTKSYKVLFNLLSLGLPGMYFCSMAFRYPFNSFFLTSPKNKKTEPN
jgi:hypothetical protein